MLTVNPLQGQSCREKFILQHELGTDPLEQGTGWGGSVLAGLQDVFFKAVTIRRPVGGVVGSRECSCAVMGCPFRSFSGTVQGN